VFEILKHFAVQQAQGGDEAKSVNELIEEAIGKYFQVEYAVNENT